MLKYNIDVLCEYICNYFPIPVRDFTSFPKLIIIRSFDVNKPGESVENLKGGVAGGSILQGVLRLEDEIEIRPGIVERNSGRGEDGQGSTVVCTPLYSKIVSLFAEQNSLQVLLLSSFFVCLFVFPLSIILFFFFFFLL